MDVQGKRIRMSGSDKEGIEEQGERKHNRFIYKSNECLP